MRIIIYHSPEIKDYLYNVEFDYARIKWLNQVNYNILVYFHHIKRGKYYGRNIIICKAYPRIGIMLLPIYILYTKYDDNI